MAENLLDMEYELSEPEIEYAESLIKEELKNDVRIDFVNQLNGTSEFKNFIVNYIEEFTKPLTEDDDLGYYDWLFHQYLRDGFEQYSLNILEDVQKRSKRKELKEIVEFFNQKYDKEQIENLTWFEVFCYIRDLNSKNNFGKFVLKGVKDA